MTSSPDALKDEARTPETPDPSLEQAFIALVARSDREEPPGAAA